MNVKLISYSQPTEEMKNLGIDSAQELVAYCARVSNPSNQLNTETSEKLIKYLIKHQHWSPLEMASACMEITTTRDIARQILRHRSFSFQEFSQRYADPTKDLNFVTREARLQDDKNRQNSVEVEDHLLQNDWYRAQQRVIYAAKREYEWAIANGIAKAIVAQRDAGQLPSTTLAMAELVASVVKTREAGQNPATRTFQAFRIFINRELEELELALDASLQVLQPRGRLVVISFHSLEDRMVKQFIAKNAKEVYDRRAPFASPVPLALRDLGRQRPSAEEVSANPRSRSAILRVAERLPVQEVA